jgi:integrase
LQDLQHELTWYYNSLHGATAGPCNTGCNMATIRKRRWRSPSGEMREAWQVDFVDQSGKRRHKQFERKKDADAYLVKARGQVAEGTYTPDSTSVTIRDAANLWLERARGENLERSTIDQYTRSVAIICALIDPDTRLARLTTPRVEQLRDDLLRAHSRAMAQKSIKHFKGIIKDARRRGLIAHSPGTETTIGTARRHRKRLEVGVDIPTPSEVKALMDAATGKARALICLAALAGLRASELRGLRWADIELGASPTVTISQRADRWSVISSPKSDAARRTIPLSETSAQALRAWKLEQPPRRSLVFGNAADHPYTLPHIGRLLAPLAAQAGVKPYGLHSFRHYAISSWLAAGIDLKQCQRWAGHATLALTLDTYGHLLPRRDDHQRIADAERVLSG